MFITGVGTARPPRKYTQRECWETLKNSVEYDELNSRSQAILRKVLLGENGIVTRYLALENLKEAFDLQPDALHARYVRTAPVLAAQAAERAMVQAKVSSEQIDAVIISTCTGYLCPGLTSYISEQLGLRADALCLDLVGQGCGAALPNLRTAEALLRAGRAEKVLSVCVEVCSAAMYLDNDPGVLISACLFGDGSGAAICSSQPVDGRRRIVWKMAGTTLSPADRDYLRFEQKNGMLRNLLAKSVPGLAAKYAENVLLEVLNKAGLDRTKISGWILHAGGRQILEAMRDRLKLREEDLQFSAEVLRENGNLSSACVYFVLERALQRQLRGGDWWMSSFGAGFSCHGALLEVSD